MFKCPFCGEERDKVIVVEMARHYQEWGVNGYNNTLYIGDNTFGDGLVRCYDCGMAITVIPEDADWDSVVRAIIEGGE